MKILANCLACNGVNIFGFDFQLFSSGGGRTSGSQYPKNLSLMAEMNEYIFQFRAKYC